MGALIDESNQQRIELRANHLFGRNDAKSDTYLTESVASSLHAALRWENNAWVLMDMSRNGTFVDGQRVQRGCGVHLKRGQRLQFGRTDGASWQFIDDASPATALVPLEPGREAIRLEQGFTLPMQDGVDLSIFQTAEERWVVETPSELRYLEDGDRLIIAGVEYRLQLNRGAELTETFDPQPLPLAHLSFLLSTDEEHTQIRMQLGNSQIDLGEREHHYLLATLARKRLKDALAETDTTAQGWIDCESLSNMLGLEIQHVNIHIFRARQQLLKLLPDRQELVNLIERRRGGVRLADIPFEIYRGAVLEGRYPPPPN